MFSYSLAFFITTLPILTLAQLQPKKKNNRNPSKSLKRRPWGIRRPCRRRTRRSENWTVSSLCWSSRSDSPTTYPKCPLSETRRKMASSRFVCVSVCKHGFSLRVIRMAYETEVLKKMFIHSSFFKKSLGQWNCFCFEQLCLDIHIS